MEKPSTSRPHAIPGEPAFTRAPTGSTAKPTTTPERARTPRVNRRQSDDQASDRVGGHAAKSESKRSRVLIVDDDKTLATLFTKALRADESEVACAHNVCDAISLLDERAFDVIVSDITMPGLSGIELLRAVRVRDADIPVVLVTGEPDVETAVRAVEHGALRYLEKPVRIDVLKRVVRRAAQLHELARARREAMGLLADQAREASERAGLNSTLDEVIDDLGMYFQPIVHCASRAPHGYEALLRSPSSVLSRPDQVLDAAERLERVHELGRRVRLRVSEAMRLVPAGALVFVNVHPSELADEELYRSDSPLSAHARRIVLEVTERARLEQVGDLDGRVAGLRELGYRIAVDDLGAGYGGLSSLVRLDPEFVKIDMALTRNVDASPIKQRLLRSTFDACRELGIVVIGEGVETRAELDTLTELGAELLQGYYLGKPRVNFRK